MGSLLGFIFGAAVCGGVMIGFSYIYIVKQVKRFGWKLVLAPHRHLVTWLDIVTSSVLFYLAVTTPSIAIPLTVANIVISTFLRWGEIKGTVMRKLRPITSRVVRFWHVAKAAYIEANK